MSLSLNVKMQGFDEAQKMLRGVKGGIEAAASRAINLGLRAGRTTGAKLVRARYNVRSSDIKEQGLAVKKATRTTLAGELQARGNMLPVTLFNPSVPKSPGKGKFLKVAIVRGPKKAIRSAFKVAGSNKIMERRQSDRLPVFSVMTIGVPHMIGSLKISNAIEKSISESTSKNMASEAQFQLNKAADAAKGAPFKRAA